MPENEKPIQPIDPMTPADEALEHECHVLLMDLLAPNLRFEDKRSLLLRLCLQQRAETWKEAAVDLSHGLPLIWKIVLIDRCESKAKELEHDV